MKMLISLTHIQLTMEEVSELFNSIQHDMVNQDVGMPKVSSGSNIQRFDKTSLISIPFDKNVNLKFHFQNC